MKKLWILAITGLFFFASCGNKAKEVPAVEPQQEECQETKSCCKELTEEQKADIAAWDDWANQTDEKKQDLLAKSKECIDKTLAECKEGECSEKCHEFKSKWETWATLSVDNQKALVDEFKEMAKAKCEKEGCCKEEAKK